MLSFNGVRFGPQVYYAEEADERGAAGIRKLRGRYSTAGCAGWMAGQVYEVGEDSTRYSR